MGDEVARREQNSFSTRLRRAQFRSTKTLEQFDFERLPQLNRALVHDLATGRYVRECSPVLIIDDFGLKPLRAPADEDLHELIAERYERTAPNAHLSADKNKEFNATKRRQIRAKYTLK